MGLKGDGMDAVVGGIKAFQEGAMMDTAWRLSFSEKKKIYKRQNVVI